MKNDFKIMMFFKTKQMPMRYARSSFILFFLFFSLSSLAINFPSLGGNSAEQFIYLNAIDPKIEDVEPEPTLLHMPSLPSTPTSTSAIPSDISSDEEFDRLAEASSEDGESEEILGPMFPGSPGFVPDEIILEILSYLSQEEIDRLAAVSKEWRRISLDQILRRKETISKYDKKCCWVFYGKGYDVISEAMDIYKSTFEMTAEQFELCNRSLLSSNRLLKRLQGNELAYWKVINHICELLDYCDRHIRDRDYGLYYIHRILNAEAGAVNRFSIRDHYLCSEGYTILDRILLTSKKANIISLDIEYDDLRTEKTIAWIRSCLCDARCKVQKIHVQESWMMNDNAGPYFDLYNKFLAIFAKIIVEAEHVHGYKIEVDGLKNFDEFYELAEQEWTTLNTDNSN